MTKSNLLLFSRIARDISGNDLQHLNDSSLSQKFSNGFFDNIIVPEKRTDEHSFIWKKIEPSSSVIWFNWLIRNRAKKSLRKAQIEWDPESAVEPRSPIGHFSKEVSLNEMVNSFILIPTIENRKLSSGHEDKTHNILGFVGAIFKKKKSKGNSPSIQVDPQTIISKYPSITYRPNPDSKLFAFKKWTELDPHSTGKRLLIQRSGWNQYYWRPWENDTFSEVKLVIERFR